MKDEARIDLETQLEEALAARQEAEQSGAELAEHALQANAALRHLELVMGEVRVLIRKDAQRRLRLERIIAFQTGIFLYQGASFLDSQGVFTESPALKLFAYLLCVAPSVYLYLRNCWQRIRVENDWNSWRDNDFVNELRKIWTEKTSSN